MECEPRFSSREAFAYFYCSRTSGQVERQDPSKVLGTILLQLSSPLRGLPIKSTIVNKYNYEKALGSQEASFSLRDCQDLISELLETHYNRVTIVLVALDEIESAKRGNLLRYLAQLAQPQKTVVKILVSSRNEPDLMDCLGRAENICIDAVENAADIELFIEKEVEERLLLGKATDDTKDKVKAVLNTKAQGMFVSSPIHMSLM